MAMLERPALIVILLALLLGGCVEQAPQLPPPAPAQQQQPSQQQTPAVESVPATPPAQETQLPLEEKFEAPARQKAKPAEATEREITPGSGSIQRQGGGDSDDMDRVD